MGVANPVSTNASNSMKSIAVLPFETHATRDISYIKSGISKMLYSRLYWKDHVLVHNVSNEKEILDTATGLPEKETVFRVANTTGAGYILCGAVTEFSGAYSLDVQVFDIIEKKVTPFYEQADSVNEVIPKLNAIAARINKKIFDRTTVAYKKLEQKDSSTQQLQRMNPEDLLNYLGDQPEHEEDIPFWKFWKFF